MDMGNKTSETPEKQTNLPIQSGITTRKPILFKLIFLGDQSVGKTSIVNRLCYDKFNNAYQPSFGADYMKKELQIEKESVTLELWDGSGNLKFKQMVTCFIKPSQIAVICYDVTNEKSFSNVPMWIEEVKNTKRDDILIYILGNKADLVNERKVATDAGVALAQKFGAEFFELSASSAFNVAEFLNNFTMVLFKNYEEKAKQSQPPQQVIQQ